MRDTLIRIKRAILMGSYRFSKKAWTEMELDRITELDVLESITNAVAIYKKIRSTRPGPTKKRDYLYIIQSPNTESKSVRNAHLH